MCFVLKEHLIFGEKLKSSDSMHKTSSDIGFLKHTNDASLSYSKIGVLPIFRKTDFAEFILVALGSSRERVQPPLTDYLTCAWSYSHNKPADSTSLCRQCAVLTMWHHMH